MRWKRKQNAADADVDITVWPPAIEHGAAYEFEPELLTPAPRNVVHRSDEPVNTPRQLITVHGVMLFVSGILTYLASVPKPGVPNSPLPIGLIIGLFAFPQLLASMHYLTAWFDRCAVASGQPLIAYAYRRDKSLTFRFQLSSEAWIYASSWSLGPEYDSGDPFTVLTVPGVHPFLYVCVYRQSEHKAS